MNDYKERIRQRVDEILPELSDLSDSLWHNPEYNFKEFFACKSMSELLKKYGFEVETGIGGIETSVKAVYDSGKPGPNIWQRSVSSAQLPGTVVSWRAQYYVRHFCRCR